MLLRMPLRSLFRGATAHVKIPASIHPIAASTLIPVVVPVRVTAGLKKLRRNQPALVLSRGK